MNEIVGVFADLERSELPVAEALIPDVLDALAWSGAEAVAGVRNRERADLWVLGEAGNGDDPCDVTEAVRRALAFGGSPLTTFRGTPIADRGGDVLGDAPPTLALVVAFAPPDPPALEELDRFYEEEHSPLLLAIPGWLRIRRFALRCSGPQRWTRLAVHDLVGASVFDDPRFAGAQATPWYRELFAHGWFAGAGRRPVRRLR